MGFISTLTERVNVSYSTITEILSAITIYQRGIAIPKITPLNASKPGKLENVVDAKEDALQQPTSAFAAQQESESPRYRERVAQEEDYSVNETARKLVDNEDANATYVDIEERVRDGKYKAMGSPFGTGKQFSAKKNEFWNNVLSKMGSYFALTTALYNLA